MGSLSLLMTNGVTNVITKVTTCTPGVELLAVSSRPFYLPREFSVAIIIAVYIPPSAVAVCACHSLNRRRPADATSQRSPLTSPRVTSLYIL